MKKIIVSSPVGAAPSPRFSNRGTNRGEGAAPTGLALVLALLALPLHAADTVQTLRGSVGVLDLGSAPPPERQAISVKPAPRDYPQQPPRIPHNVQGLLVQTRVNMCLACHARRTEQRSSAAKLPDSHFLDRAGDTTTDTVAPRRWFCMQCHVPQADTPPLVSNTYRAPQATRK